MILSDHTIHDLCENWASTAGVTGPIVDPYTPQQLNPASYDMLLGDEFVVFDAEQQVCIDLQYPISDETTRTVKTDGDPIVIQPGQFMLGVTVEKVNMPHSIAGRLDGKSSLARAGLLIHLTGGNIDPGFCGPITLEIFNARRCPIILHPGLPFCQLVFQMMSTPATKPYNGRYQHATGVEASKYGKDLDQVKAERLGNMVDMGALAKWAAKEGTEPPYKERPGIVQPFQDRPLKE